MNRDTSPVEHSVPDDRHLYDPEFRAATIAAVTATSTGWEIEDNKGWSFWVPRHYGVEPHPGDAVRFYGRGIGTVVRGLTINDQMAYYRSEDEERARFEQEMAAHDIERRRLFEENRADHDARIAALPEVFQRRITKFQSANPDFRWKHESYELFSCEQAVLIASTVQTAEALQDFIKADWEAQKLLVPGLSDQHSGNTFGMACRLAHWYLEVPEQVIAEHGALVSLTGCEEYGCLHPETAEAQP